MVERGSCRRCGVETVRLRCFDGTVRIFHAREAANPDLDESQRWYYTATRGAINGADASAPPNRPYLTLHQCLRTRAGFGESTGSEAGTIRAGDAVALRTDVPTVNDSALSLTGYRWTYRWPSHRAHIITGRAPQALCGATVLVPEEMSERERARISTMHVCPRCVQTNARHERTRR